MSQTLINVNQNNLNNQTGSYVELIKNTQQAKENLTTALVDKGANVSSESTFTDLVNATNNLIVNNSDLLCCNVGATNDSIGNNNSTYQNLNTPDGFSNEWGSWIIKQTNATTLTLYNMSPENYTASSGGLFNYDFTINQALINPSDNRFQIIWHNLDYTKIAYIGSDKVSIYVYQINYARIVANETSDLFTLIKTYTLTSQCNNNATIVNYDELNKSFLIYDTATSYGYDSPGGSYLFKNIDFSDESSPVTTSFSLQNFNSYYYSCCLLIDKNRFLVFQTVSTSTGNVRNVSLCRVDYTNNIIIKVADIFQIVNLDVQKTGRGCFIKINNRDAYIISLMRSDSSLLKNSLFILYLDDYSYEISDINVYIYDKQNTWVGNLLGLIPFKYNNDLYIAGVPPSVIWKITSDGTIEKRNSFCVGINVNHAYGKSMGIFNPPSDKVLYLSDWGKYIIKDIKYGNYHIGFKNDDNLFYVKGSDWSDARSKVKLIEGPELLVEDN